MDRVQRVSTKVLDSLFLSGVESDSVSHLCKGSPSGREGSYTLTVPVGQNLGGLDSNHINATRILIRFL